MGFSDRVEAVSILLSKVENIAFTKMAQFPGSQRHVSWLFQSCVKTHIRHTVLFHDKDCQGRVFCEC